MSEDQHPIAINKLSGKELYAQIEELRTELDQIERIVLAFESKLRLAIEDQLIEEQELNTLYKQLQKAKKEKRLEQKKKGKNYIPPTGVKKQSVTKPNVETLPEEIKERKRLYREAMLLVHPDKFSMQEDGQEDIATEITAQLIEIYQSGTLQELIAFHAHITGGVAINMKTQSKIIPRPKVDPLLHLQNQIEKLERKLFEAKNRHTYVVWITYEDPYTFILELKEYYTDRIFKLKKRTRKAR